MLVKSNVSSMRIRNEYKDMYKAGENNGKTASKNADKTSQQSRTNKGSKHSMKKIQ